jgi:integrase
VRAGTTFAWIVPHTYRKTVATMLDQQGLSARTIADQLGHARISMTQDVYMGRRVVTNRPHLRWHGQAAAIPRIKPTAQPTPPPAATNGQTPCRP